MPGMQGLRSVPLGHPHDAHGVQIAFAGRIAADADEPVDRRTQQAGSRRFHIGVRLHQHHFEAVLLGLADNLLGRAAARVHQDPGERGGPHLLADFDGGFFLGRLELEPQYAADHLFDRFSSRGDGGIDGPQRVVQPFVEGVPHEAPHGARLAAEVIREGGSARQVLGHHDLAGERHVGACPIVSLHQRVGHKAGLRASGAVAESEAHHRQACLADESRNAVVQHCHGEQGAGALLGLHASGGDERDHRQAPLGALHQQPAELLGGRHIERSGLEFEVGHHHADVPPRGAGLKARDAGDGAAGGNAFRQRLFDGGAKAREAGRVGGHQPRIRLAKIHENRSRMALAVIGLCFLSCCSSS